MKNFHVFKSSSILVNTTENVSRRNIYSGAVNNTLEQIDTLIYELTNGGKISASNKIRLYEFIKNWFLSSKNFKNKYFPNIFVKQHI
uniref:Uncharacterized protein n=1 Tax=Moumouvirus sp. 'Monve' TaxID=1128131 RepID=H2EFN8_9VIRU|nr:hypothetical protein mv_L1101 [Moumouvirus Monve]